MNDIEDLMARVQAQQEEVERIQRSVTQLTVEGYSRNNEVTVRLRGTGRFSEISIDPDAVRALDAAALGDIVMEAVNDGLQRLGEASAARFAPVVARAGTEV
jgi:DNA-binding YbaB/EbfC family protein